MTLEETKTLQFELWQECNNGCSFCYLGKENRKTDNKLKLASLQRVYNIISDASNYPKYNCISYIGGEFFQGQLQDSDVRNAFFKLMGKTAELYNTKTIKEVWIAATLTIGDQRDLYRTLDLYDNWDNVQIITSQDAIGRFKTKKMKETQDFHMKNLKKMYPGIKLNITTILTDEVINRYISGELSFKALTEEYDASLFFKQCGVIYDAHNENDFNDLALSKKRSNEKLPHFFPTRQRFIQFLKLFRIQESEDMWSRLFNIKYRADNLYRSFNDGSTDVYYRYKNTKGEVSDSQPMPCGHPFVYCAYLDSNACILCDKQKFSLL